MVRSMNVAAMMVVSVALAISSVGAVCRNGIEGVGSTSLDVCCVEACGQCGGPGCNPGANSTLTESDCCATEIADFGQLCSVTGVAPCIITNEAAPETSTCVNGLTGVQDPDTDVCCPLECGTQCGGDGCGIVPGVPASSCCASAIMNSGVECTDTEGPPCIVVAAPTAGNSTTCSNGLAGIEDGTACCSEACGQCGGGGCGNIPGLTGSECCSAVIASEGTLCSVTGAAPCVIDPPEVTPSTCPNGLAGVQDGSVCCAEACGQCGGVGCGSIAGTNGPDDCCSATILASGVTCGTGVAAPCIMQNGTYTNAPTVAPVAGATVSPTAGSRAIDTFSMAPTQAGMEMTSMPTPGSRGLDTGVPTPAPTTTEELETTAPTTGSRGIDIPSEPTTASPSSSPTDGMVLPPGTTLPPGAPAAPTSGAAVASAGSLITITAMAAGAFAVMAAVRN